MQENISEKSGFVRLALGTGLTAFGVAHLTKDSGSKSLGSALVIAGAMKVAEGIFLYCPMKALLNSNVKEAVYTSFDEYMDGDSLLRAYNDAYENRWGSEQNNNKSQKKSTSWTDTGLAKAASQAMDAVSKGEDFSDVVQSFNGGNTSGSSSSQSNQSKSSNSGQSATNPS
ncbi:MULTISPECIES: DUF2892 domain-containing protein [Lysinibacillus]|uniref:DUF2892 domain-containing protein n=1 Tax=Lysinibacillus antri TaxID=2498145 RepID=A0A3S0QNJ3_9BACI|nr:MULTISPECIES: DUF2892 domain-containing protein [Lysinibacillus]RUL49312.1 DUF2892 domain-containing protein [Lysinibacillus antri]TSI10571.1 DUF2892 domain-containing protein [Lysinibacillus sp. BW-2-10]